MKPQHRPKLKTWARRQNQAIYGCLVITSITLKQVTNGTRVNGSRHDRVTTGMHRTGNNSGPSGFLLPDAGTKIISNCYGENTRFPGGVSELRMTVAGQRRCRLTAFGNSNQEPIACQVAIPPRRDGVRRTEGQRVPIAPRGTSNDCIRRQSPIPAE